MKNNENEIVYSPKYEDQFLSFNFIFNDIKVRKQKLNNPELPSIMMDNSG